VRILLVEDDDRISKPIAEDLRNQRYVVEIAEDGVEGWEYLQTIYYDLILLDLMLPRLDGITLCKRLRNSGYRGFVLMLTAKDTLSDKVIGLDAGADDYLIKPFELDELSARMRALLRRPSEIRPSILRESELMLDPTTHEVFYAENLLKLTPKEYLLLEYFLQYPGRVFTRTILLDKLWEIDRSSSESTVKTHISNLRRKLKKAGCEIPSIETIYGVGYCLRTSEGRSS